DMSGRLFFFSSRRRHTSFSRDWSSDVCSSDLAGQLPWGEGHHEAHAALLDRTAGLLAICEDLPEPHNRVTLDPELKDAHGIPAPRIDYRLSENSERMLTFGAARAQEVLAAAGALRSHVEAPLGVAG